MPVFCDHCGLPATGGVQGADDTHFCCYGCRMMAETVGSDSAETDAEGFSEQQVLLIRLFAGALMAGFVMVLSLAISTGYGFGALQQLVHDVGTAHWVLLAAAVPALLLLGPPVLRAAGADLRDGRLSLNVLFALGTTSAIAVSAVTYVRGTGPIYLETAVMLLALYTLGRYLTARAKGRATQVLRHLIEIPDATYTRLSSSAGAEAPVEVSPDELQVGDRVRIRAGDVIPVDGRVIDGTSYVDERSLTGENRPAVRSPGDSVYAGTEALDGSLVLDVTATGSERRLARVEAMMRETLARPPRIARLTDRVLQWVIPGVVVLALATFGVWWVVAGLAKAVYVSLSVVLITCPCALGIAIPLALVVGLDEAARQGVLMTSGQSLLNWASVRAVAFDKTGTLSALDAPSVEVWTPEAVAAGVPSAAPPDPNTLLRQAAAVETGTRHALATALTDAADARGLDLPPAHDLTTHPGAGVVGVVDVDGLPCRVGVGNERLLDTLGIAPSPDAQSRFQTAIEAGHTPLYVTQNDAVAAVLTIEEAATDAAAAAVRDLQAQGLAVRMLTGDRPEAAERLGARLRMDVEAGLTPEAKVRRLENLRQETGPIAMVGDGINDAAALAEADVGVALSTGAGVSIEAADVTLYNADLRLLPWLRELAEQTRRVIRQNLGWTLGYNAAGLGLAVAGLLHPIAAVLIMTVSSLMVTANAFRLRRLDPPETAR